MPADLLQIKMRVNAQQLKLSRSKLQPDLAMSFRRQLRRYLKLVADIKDGADV